MALNSLLVNGQRASFVVLPCRNKGNAGAVAIYGAGVRRVLGLGALVRGEQLERRQSSLIPDETYTWSTFLTKISHLFLFFFFFEYFLRFWTCSTEFQMFFRTPFFLQEIFLSTSSLHTNEFDTTTVQYVLLCGLALALSCLTEKAVKAKIDFLVSN